MILDHSPLRDVLAALEAALEIVSDASWFPGQPELVRNTLVAGVIQNLEFVHEIGVKMPKRRIEAEAASPDEIAAAEMLVAGGGFRPVHGRGPGR